MAIKNENSPITVVLTSCDRFDLLPVTLASFFSKYKGELRDFIIIEDSGSLKVHDVVAQFKDQFPITVVVNESSLGQLASIDKAYSMVKSPYIFHMEDDWTFSRDGFIEESLQMLEENPKVFSIWLRDISEFAGHKGEVEHCGQSFYIAQTTLSFNPTLVRLADYKRHRPYNKFAGYRHFEADLSHLFEAEGMYSVITKNPVVTHLGWHRRVRAMEATKMPRFILALEQVVKRFKSKFYKFFKMKHFKDKKY